METKKNYTISITQKALKLNWNYNLTPKILKNCPNDMKTWKIELGKKSMN